MADEKGHPPVHLPAGSIDVQELHKQLETAVSIKDEEKRPERINKAIIAAASPLTREVIASGGQPAVPLGAEVVRQEIVYAEGQDPVETDGIRFKGAEGAKSGAEAAEMRYEQTDAGKVEVTDAPAVATPGGDENSDAATLSQLAAEKTGNAAESTGGRSTTRSDT